ncbi:MAG TPA: ATP-binding protein [Acidobacteriota bacterium]|nr:ATP-binding protein [Acidobacteriota bacterium]
MKAPRPAREAERLQVLSQYEILDTAPEKEFDELTSLAAKICQAPVALISLIDDNRQWFKSKVGVSVSETTRDVSFCAHAILQPETLIVPDTLKDERFADNPLVTDDPRIRFYAGVPLVAPEGHAVGTLCVIDRVPRELSTEQKEALRILSHYVMTQLELRRRSREFENLSAQLKNIFDNLDNVFFSLDVVNKKLLQISPACERIYGLPRQAFLDNIWIWKEVIHPEDVLAVDADLPGLYAGKTMHNEYRIILPDGNIRWVATTAKPCLDAAGKVARIDGIVSDISARKELEQLRDNLTHMIVHDLKIPLTGISGYLDLLKMAAADKLGGDESGYLEEARTSISVLLDMIMSLLDIGRLEAGHMQLNLSVCDLEDLAREALDKVISLKGKRGLTIETSAEHLLISADPDVIVRVITNLVGNALKFTTEDGIVRVKLDKTGEGRVRLSVSDNGPGIPAQFHERIFEKFGQVSAGRTAPKYSTGLGLTFCKLAIEAHRGRIGLESQVGKGSTFWFELPESN